MREIGDSALLVSPQRTGLNRWECPLLPMFLGIDHPVSSITARILRDLVNPVDQQIGGPADGAEVDSQFSRRNHHDFRNVVDHRETPVVGEREHVKTGGRILSGYRLWRKVTVTHRRVRVQRAPKPFTGTLKNVGV